MLSLVLGPFGAPARAEEVSVSHDAANVQASYAAAQLRAALDRRKVAVVEAGQVGSFPIVLSIKTGGLAPQAYAIDARPGSLTITGGDGRGLIYGALAVVEQLDKGVPVRRMQSASEKPTVAFRAIKFDLPWDSYRASAAIGQHSDTVRDPRYWEAFFDMLVRNRFNAITLSNLHPWPYMVRTKGYPAANPFDDRQLEEWKQLHKTIFRLAKERGIDTYLLPFNIFVSKEFAEAYGVGKLNTYPRYNTKGEKSPIVRDYVRASIGQVLEEYPDLTGLGINLGEGMGEMTAAERIGYVNDTYLAAIRDARRPVKLIWSINSVETKEWQQTGHDPRIDEQMLRDTIEKIDFVDGPIQINFKFNWSHALSTTRLAQIHGGRMGDTYFKPLPKNYRINWIARNEDVFALRWGVPSFVREHVKANGTPAYVGGYTVGSETYIPARDYFTAADSHAQWTYAFERQWLFYMLWGRLLYNPDTPDKVFSDEFTRRYGEKGKSLLGAFEHASATPLRLASLFYSQWDHTLYSEGMMWLDGRTMQYISVDDLIRQPVLDPTYVNIADYVATTAKGQSFPAGRMTPPMIADRLEADSRRALQLVKDIDPGKDLALPYEVADVRTWAHLGLHLAAKIRGGVALQTFRTGGDAGAKQQAVSQLETALAEWDEVVKITTPLYRPMLLTHFTGQSSALNPDAEFHWKGLRQSVAADVEAARNASPASAK
ncbi:hypothetical protein C0V78_07425 [Novosphingobium sp. TH158]|nr:hypothetical protein C0V78_07425 [Novosphingobium sp. TH158]